MNKHLISAALLACALGACDGAITSSPNDDISVDPATAVSDVRFGRGRFNRDAGTAPTADGGWVTPTADAGTPTPTPVDAGTPTPTPVDAGSPTTTRDAGTTPTPTPTPDAGSPSSCVGAGCTCVRATEMWSDGFETGDYSNWTGRGYGDPWGDSCQNNAITTVHPHTGRYAQRNEIVCASSDPGGVHRGYGGLQFSGDTVLPGHTNTGTGLSAPNGIVTTFYTWLEAGYAFGDGKWISLFTVNPTCGYTERVITLGLDNRDGIMRAAHYWPEGTQTIAPGAPAFPMGRWVRVTVYLNFANGQMHVWQDGQSVLHVNNITRTTQTMCQWHWGLYASADNTDVVMYEDDKIVWRMEQPWTDFTREPWLGESQAVCD